MCCFARSSPRSIALRELDLLRRRQQRVAAGLAEEELQRVGRRLARRRRRGGGAGGLLGLGLLDDVDAAGLELVAQRLELERLQLERLDELEQVQHAHGACGLGAVDEELQLLPVEEPLDDVRLGHGTAYFSRPRLGNPRRRGIGFRVGQLDITSILVRWRRSGSTPLNVAGEHASRHEQYEQDGEEREVPCEQERGRPDFEIRLVVEVPVRNPEVGQVRGSGERDDGHRAPPSRHEGHHREQPGDVLRRENRAEREHCGDRGRGEAKQFLSEVEPGSPEADPEPTQDGHEQHVHRGLHEGDPWAAQVEADEAAPGALSNESERPDIQPVGRVARQHENGARQSLDLEPSTKLHLQRVPCVARGGRREGKDDGDSGGNGDARHPQSLPSAALPERDDRQHRDQQSGVDLRRRAEAEHRAADPIAAADRRRQCGGREGCGQHVEPLDQDLPQEQWRASHDCEREHRGSHRSIHRAQRDGRQDEDQREEQQHERGERAVVPPGFGVQRRPGRTVNAASRDQTRCRGDEQREGTRRVLQVEVAVGHRSVEHQGPVPLIAGDVGTGDRLDGPFRRTERDHQDGERDDNQTDEPTQAEWLIPAGGVHQRRNVHRVAGGVPVGSSTRSADAIVHRRRPSIPPTVDEAPRRLRSRPRDDPHVRCRRGRPAVRSWR